MTYRSCPDHKLEPMDTCRVCKREAQGVDHRTHAANVRAAIHASRDRADAQEEVR